jgi:tetratricopeptide (TPR) repeat protein
MKNIQNNWLILLFLFACMTTMYAHGDLHRRIIEATKEIKKHPDSAYLYFKRGKLYYQHKVFKRSIKDLKKSNQLGYRTNEKYFLLSKNYIKLKKYNLSLKYARKILVDQPNNVNALKLVGKIYYDKGHFKLSGVAFEKVIAYSKETFPENYLDASMAWYALKNDIGIVRAKFILLEGIEKLGNNIVLFQRLISIAVDQNDFALAIEYQKRVIDFSRRKERAYLKLTEFYIITNNFLEAELSFKKAKNLYDKLPIRIKNTGFMKEFLNELELKEVQLKYLELLK